MRQFNHSNCKTKATKKRKEVHRKSRERQKRRKWLIHLQKYRSVVSMLYSLWQIPNSNALSHSKARSLCITFASVSPLPSSSSLSYPSCTLFAPTHSTKVTQCKRIIYRISLNAVITRTYVHNSKKWIGWKISIEKLSTGNIRFEKWNCKQSSQFILTGWQPTKIINKQKKSGNSTNLIERITKFVFVIFTNNDNWK